MLRHERLLQLAQRIEKGRSPLRWLDLYAAQSLLQMMEEGGTRAHSGTDVDAEPDTSFNQVDARTVDLLVLCSASSIIGHIAVVLSDLTAYQSLGLFVGGGLSVKQDDLSGDDESISNSASGPSELTNCLALLRDGGLLQSQSFLPDDENGVELSEVMSDEQGANSPLVLTDGRLYLRRVWLQRRSLECWLSGRQRCSEDVLRAGLDESGQDHVSAYLQRSFRLLFKTEPSGASLAQGKRDAKRKPVNNDVEPDWQAVAAVQALTQSFCLVSGGPGTGKTSTAARILVLLLARHALKNKTKAVVRLLAPTGKAAVLLHTSILQQFQDLCELLRGASEAQEPGLHEDTLALIDKSFPEQGETIHRALLRVPGAVGDDSLIDRRNFHHSDTLLLGRAEQASLRADIVLIDEASMIDQKLMSDLVSAIPNSSRVVIMGDHFQLPPVEPGEVFADWIARLEQCDYSSSQTETLEAYGCALPSSLRLVERGDEAPARLICQLTKTYRFSGPIFDLAQALRGYSDWSVESLLPLSTPLGRASGPEDLFERAPLTWVDLDARSSAGDRVVGESIKRESSVREKGVDVQLADHFDASLSGYEAYFELVNAGADVAQLAAEKDRFQILCSTYEGPLGATNINRLIEQRFAQSQRLYEGKVVMVTQNQPDLDVYNGDVGYLQLVNQGALLSSKQNSPSGFAGVDQPQFAVAFPDKIDGDLHVPLALIRQWQSAYAISIHKSQGCEYERVMVVVPDYARDLVTRRLAYTGITRSQKEVELWISRTSLSRLGGK